MHMKKTHIFPNSMLFLAGMSLMLTASCGDTPSAGSDITTTPVLTKPLSPDTSDPDTPLPPSATPSPSAAPTPVPGAYTPEAAADQIRAFLDVEHYDITLVSSDLHVETQDYYTFLISQKGSAVEPLILVDKKDGNLKCILSDNTMQEISMHPLYHDTDSDDTTISWNGTYIIKAEDGSLLSYIIMEQTDDGHFEFTAYSYLDSKVEELSGVAQIAGERASFTSDSGASLTFSWSGANLVLDHTHPAQGATLTGIYTYTEEQDSKVVTVPPQEVLDRLAKLDAAQTGLGGNMQDYLFYMQDDVTIMNDRLCYNVLVYSSEGYRLFYQAQFFITLDGGTVYCQGKASDDIQIFSLQ